MSQLLHCGNLVNDLIKDNHSALPLSGMINPTFQNQGTASVTIDGRILMPDETFTVFAPIVLQNAIPIVFEADKTKTRKLYLSYVSVI
ncbi:hypothetical protein [Flavobacterium fluviatile]|uniref:hypothetical protein n=1 Tax=Flavobacterium fluviatile TaxID=1862387 RepID=UPI0013D752E4|nr:hypothetical protein [Flavobacterium fluviatile]